MKPSQIPISSSTQGYIDIEDIASDLVILKDGSACVVLEVSATNFGLLSEKEQDAIIFAYAQLLNSLTFAIQIIISSKQKDISDYINLLNSRLEKITSPLLKDQLVKYRDFVSSVVRQGNVLDKKFYVVIPFSSLELGAGTNIMSLGRKKDTAPAIPKEVILERALTNLSPKRDHLIRLFARIGLRARQLTSGELLQLFFDFYNRDQIGTHVNLPKTATNP